MNAALPHQALLFPSGFSKSSSPVSAESAISADEWEGDVLAIKIVNFPIDLKIRFQISGVQFLKSPYVC